MVFFAVDDFSKLEDSGLLFCGCFLRTVWLNTNTQLVTIQKWTGLQIGKMYLATGNLHLNAVILCVRRKKD